MTVTEVHHHEIDPEVHARRWIILGALCLSLVLVVAAVSSINTAIPSIRVQLEPTDAQLLWIVDIYAVVFAGLLLPAGALGDRFGRKGALQLGLAIFAIASVMSSQAGSPGPLLVFRCLMGVGAALIMPSTLSLLTSVFPPHERPKAIAVWAGFAGAGSVIGSLVGGFALTHFWFGSVFFVSVPIAVIALVMVTLLCPTSRESAQTPLDPIGAVLSVVGFGALLYGIIEGPEKGWASVHSVGAFALSVVALASFIAWERRTRHPMLDMRFFSIPRFGAGSLGVTVAFFCMFSMFFLITQYLQSVRGYSPLLAGVCTLPSAATMVVLSPRASTLADRVGPRQVVFTGLLLIPAGLLMLSLIDTHTNYAFIAVALIVFSAGGALALPTLSSGIVLSLPMDKAGVGSAVNDTTREVGGAVGIAIIGSVLSAYYRRGVNPVLADAPEQVADVARDGVSALSGLVDHAKGDPALQDQVPALQRLLGIARESFLSGMHVGLRASAVFGIVAAIVVWRWYPTGALRPIGMAPQDD